MTANWQKQYLVCSYSFMCMNIQQRLKSLKLNNLILCRSSPCLLWKQQGALMNEVPGRVFHPWAPSCEVEAEIISRPIFKVERGKRLRRLHGCRLVVGRVVNWERVRYEQSSNQHDNKQEKKKKPTKTKEKLHGNVGAFKVISNVWRSEGAIIRQLDLEHNTTPTLKKLDKCRKDTLWSEPKHSAQ